MNINELKSWPEKIDGKTEHIATKVLYDKQELRKLTKYINFLHHHVVIPVPHSAQH